MDLSIDVNDIIQELRDSEAEARFETMVMKKTLEKAQNYIKELEDRLAEYQLNEAAKAQVGEERDWPEEFDGEAVEPDSVTVLGAPGLQT